MHIERKNADVFIFCTSVPCHIANITSLSTSENASERVDCHYDRWFVVQSVDSEQPVSKLSPFIIDKAIRSAVGTVKTIRSLRNGDFLLEVSSATQSH